MSDTVVRLTTANADHAPLVRQIMLDAFAEFRGTLEPPSSALDETLDDTRRAIDAGGAALAWLGDQAVGSVRYLPRPGYLYVGRLAVLPAHRGRGIAAALMNAMEEQARALGLPEIRVEVRLSLPGNVALFRRLGFQTISEQPHPRGPAYWTIILGKPLPNE
jgi:ribosomal protein S18 acetylase RimI-like enzyme